MKNAMLFLGLHDVAAIGGCYTCDVGAPDADGNVTGQVYLLKFGGTELRLCRDCLHELQWLIAEAPGTSITTAISELTAAVDGAFDGVDAEAYVAAVRGDGPEYSMPDGTKVG